MCVYNKCKCMQGLVIRPVRLIFQPTAVEVVFERSLKLQIAIFRATTDEKGKRVVKMDKTDPMKFSNPMEKIVLTHSLSLLTTIQYQAESRRFESKEVEFEMAMEVDGSKVRMTKKINLRDVLGGKQRNGKFVMESPEVVVLFKAEVRFQDEGQGQKEKEKDKDKEKQKEGKRKIRFEEDVNVMVKQQAKENIKEDGQPLKLQKRGDKGRHKTMAVEPIPSGGAITSRRELGQAENKLKKCKSVSRPEEMPRCEPPGKQENISIEGRIKSQQIQSRCGDLASANRELQRKVKQREGRIGELDQRIQQLQRKMVQAESKSQRVAKQGSKRQQMLKAGYQKQLGQLREQIKCYKVQIQKLSKTALNYQESSKNIAFGSEVEIKTLRDQLRKLQKAHQQCGRESQIYERQLRDKDDIITDLKSRIYLLDKENLQLQCKVKGLQSKLQKTEEEFGGEIEELQAKIGEIKQENKTLKMPTQKQIKEEGGGDLRKKVQLLQKQLQRKEQLLRKMTEMKKQAEEDRVVENASLRKQISELKEVVERLESRKGEEISSSSSIEYRVQMEKMKKELEICKKSEKALLIEKSRLETSNRQLQDDVVRGKMVVANILNVVQETGDEKLISEAYSLTE